MAHLDGRTRYPRRTANCDHGDGIPNRAQRLAIRNTTITHRNSHCSGNPGSHSGDVAHGIR